MRFVLAFLAFMAPAAAFAQCSPPNAGAGTMGCQPSLGAPQSTDLIEAWRPSSFPASTGTLTVGELLAGGIPTNVPLTLTAPGTALTVTNNASVGGTLNPNGLLTVGGNSVSWTGSSFYSSVISAFANQTGTLNSGGTYSAFGFQIPSNTLNTTAATNGFFGFSMQQNFGGGGQTGGITNMLSTLNQTGAVTGAGFYAGIEDWISVSNTSGGADAIAFNPQVNITTGGTGWTLAELAEGAVSSAEPIGARVGFDVFAGGSNQGSSYDFAYGIALSPGSTAPWLVGISFGNPLSAWPIAPTGTMIGTTVSGGSLTAAYGINLSAVTFSTASLALPGFTVNGAGSTTITGDGTLTGGSDLLVGSSTATSALVALNAAATDPAGTVYLEAGVERWAVNMQDGNQDFSFFRYNSSGVFVDTPVQISGLSGMLNVADGITLTGTLPTGTPASYACFTSAGKIISSATAC